MIHAGFSVYSLFRNIELSAFFSFAIRHLGKEEQTGCVYS